MKATKQLLSCLLLFCACFFFPTLKADANTMLQATPLGVNSSVTGSLTENEEVYYYRIDLPSSGYFSINNLTSDMERFGFCLYDVAGEDLASDTLSENGGVPGMGTFGYHLSKGTYYLRLIGNYGNWSSSQYYGNYRFSTSFVSAGVNHPETGNDISKAHFISSGSAIKGQFSITDQVDFFRIDLPTPGTLEIQKLSNFRKFGTRIYDVNYESITGNTLYWDSAAEKGSGTETYYLAAGTYYLRMSGGEWGSSSTYYSGNYDFTVRFTSAGVNHSEPANGFPNAAPVSTGTTITGMIAENDPVDYYQLTLNKATKLKIVNTLFLARLGVQFYNSSFQKVDDCGYTIFWDNASKSKTETKELSLSAGTYYVRVIGNYHDSSYENSFGKYQIRFGGSSGSTVVTPTKKSLSKATVSKISTRTYTGKSMVPSLNVRYGNSLLKKGRDYVVSAKNNKYPGKATLTLTGKGNYTGKKTVSFYIKPKRATITSLKSPSRGKASIRFKKQTRVTGYQIYYSTRKSGGYRKLKTTSGLSYTKKLKSRRTYYFKVRAYKLYGSRAIYGSFSPVKSVRIK